MLLVSGPQLDMCDLSLGPGSGYEGEERAVSDSFGAGEWDDRKVRHNFIRKVSCVLGGPLGLGSGEGQASLTPWHSLLYITGGSAKSSLRGWCHGGFGCHL